MKIKIIVIDPELSTRTKRILAAVAIPAVLLGGAAVAWAGTLKSWSNGETLAAADLNANFEQLNAAIVPPGAIVAFNLSTCPAGWSAFSAAGGRTIIGVNPPGGNGLSQRDLGATVGEETHSQTVSEMAPHVHDLLVRNAAPSAVGGFWGFDWATNGMYQTNTSSEATYGSGLQNFMTVESKGAGAPFTQMQPSVALLYCQKT